MSGSEKKVNEKTYDFFSIKRVTKKFLEVSCCSRAKQRQRNVQKKKVCCTCKVAFFANWTFCCLVIFLLPFAAYHYTILYFV